MFENGVQVFVSVLFKLDDSLPFITLLF